MVLRDTATEEALYKDVFGDSDLLDLSAEDGDGKEGHNVLQDPGEKADGSESALSEDSFFDDENVDRAAEQDLRNQKARGLSWAVARAEDEEFRQTLDQQAREEAINLQSLGREPLPKWAFRNQFGTSANLVLKQLSPLTVSDSPMSRVTAIQVHPNGRLAIVASLDHRIRLYEVSDPTNLLISSFLFPEINPTSAFFSDNYKWLVVTGNTMFYHIFDLSTGTDIKRRLPLRKRYPKDTPISYFLTNQHKEARVCSMQSAVPGWQGSNLVFFSECSSVVNYDYGDRRETEQRDMGAISGMRAGQDAHADTPQFQTDRYTFVYGLQLETNSYAYKLQFPFPTTGFLGVISPSDSDLSRVSGHTITNPTLVVSGRGHGVIAIQEFDVTNFYASQKPIFFGNDSFSITAMAVSPVFIATGDESGFINVYRISDVYSVHSAREGTAAEQDSDYAPYQVLRVKPTYIIKNLVDEISSLHFNPSSEILVAASVSNNVRFTNMVTGRVFNIQKPPSGGTAFSFTPDLTKVFCGGRCGVVESYELIASS